MTRPSNPTLTDSDVAKGWTPGPWSVEVDDASGIGRTHAVYVCAGKWPEGQLARVNVQDGLGEREANARLIAAAPDLYEALEGAIGALEQDYDTSLEYGDADWEGLAFQRLEAARAALAKATGQ